MRMVGAGTGITLEKNFVRMELLSQTRAEFFKVHIVAKRMTETDLAFEDCLRPGKASLRQQSGQDPGLRRSPGKDPLFHRAAIELTDTAGEVARDADCRHESLRVKPKKLAGGNH